MPAYARPSNPDYPLEIKLNNLRISREKFAEISGISTRSLQRYAQAGTPFEVQRFIELLEVVVLEQKPASWITGLRLFISAFGSQKEAA